MILKRSLEVQRTAYVSSTCFVTFQQPVRHNSGCLLSHRVCQDWRDHVDQMHHYADAIQSCLKDTRGQLERLSDDISRTLEKITSRERYVNQELHYQLNGLKSAHDRRAERKETYRQASVGLADKSKYLVEVCRLFCEQ